MKLLAIETSCDDTAAAVVEDYRIRSNIVAAQDEVHAPYGGVVPELAARRHLENLGAVVEAATSEDGAGLAGLDGIAVTRGPGLVGSLLVGISMAQGLGLRLGLPVFGINHLEGHVLSALIGNDVEFPFLSLLVSGGHTAIYLVRGVGEYREVAATRDDSAGEAFDKAAKMLGLGYPGGRVIDGLAASGDPQAFRFPRARVRSDPMALSFSGLKTALWEFLRDSPEALASPADACASFQEAVVDQLTDRVLKASKRFKIDRIAVSGGVSANSRLRAAMEALGGSHGLQVWFPAPGMCTDNAAMIGHAAVQRSKRDRLLPSELRAVSRLPLGRSLGAP